MADTPSWFLEERKVDDFMTKGGCFQSFAKAVLWCHPKYTDRMPCNCRGGVADVEACDVGDMETRGAVYVETRGPFDVEECVKATAALRRCFAGNPEWFGREYLHRMDKGLDEDLKPSPDEVKMEAEQRFRWWTGMRRS